MLLLYLPLEKSFIVGQGQIKAGMRRGDHGVD